MEKEEMQIAFHDLLNFATSIRNIVYIILMEKTQPDKQAEDYLRDCLNRCNQLVDSLQNLQRDWLHKKHAPSP